MQSPPPLLHVLTDTCIIQHTGPRGYHPKVFPNSLTVWAYRGFCFSLCLSNIFQFVTLTHLICAGPKTFILGDFVLLGVQTLLLVDFVNYILQMYVDLPPPPPRQDLNVPKLGLSGTPPPSDTRFICCLVTRGNTVE